MEDGLRIIHEGVAALSEQEATGYRFEKSTLESWPTEPMWRGHRKWSTGRSRY